MSGNQMILLGGSQAPAVDPYFYSVTSLLHGDGTNGGQNNTFLDSSTNNFTITRNGNTTQGSFSPFSQTGWSGYFDGSGDYCTLSSNASMDFGAGNFTIECFVNTGVFSVSAGASRTIIGNSGNSYTMQLYIDTTSGRVVFGNTGSTFLQGTGTVADNQWHHVVVVRSGTGSNQTAIFVDGQRQAVGTNSQNYSSGTIYLGAFDTGNGFWNGYISNLRIVKGTAVYDPTLTTLTVPTTPLTAVSNTALLTLQSNRFLDNSTNAYTVTKAGDTSIQPFSPFNPTTPYSTSSIGGSGYFDGSGDNLTATNNAAYDFGGGNFTIEGWARPTTASQLAFAARGQSTGFEGWILSTTNFLATTNGSTWDITITFTSALVANAWNHVAVVRNGNVYTAYLNGVANGTTTVSGSIVAGTAAAIIGSRVGQTDYSGYIGDFRIVKGTAVYTAAFTPPTAPLTAISGTSLLLSGTNGAIFDNAAVADYETVGNAQISTSVKKYGTGSMAFDGTGDYLLTDPPSAQLMAFGTGDFTVEMWVYFNAIGTNVYHFYDSRPASTDGAYPTLRTNASSQLEYVANSAVRITGLTLTTNTWYHVALCRTASQTKLFVNGTQTGSTYADTTNYLNAAARPLIGGSGFHVTTLSLNGYVDDVRISKGIARYPYNFTPPTAEFPNIGGTVTLTADPYFDYTTLLLPGNGTNGAQNNTFLDSSTNNFTITRNGNTTQGTFSPFSQTGWGNYFDGNGDELTLSTTTAAQIGANDFSFECFVYATRQTNTFAQGLISYGIVGNTSGTSYASFQLSPSGNLNFFYADTSAAALADPSLFPINQWIHAVVCRSGSTLSMFVNGSRVATTTTSATVGSSGDIITIGGQWFANASTRQLQGYISNARIVKGSSAYSASSSTLTPPTAPLTAITNTSLLTCQSNRFIDNSSNAFAITRNGDVSVQAFSPFNPTAAWSASTNGGSGYFDGSGDYLNGPATGQFAPTGNFTISMWIYPTSFAASFYVLAGSWNTGTSNEWLIQYDNTGAIRFLTTTDSTFSAAGVIKLNQWQFISISRTGSTLTGYVNGTSFRSYTLTGTVGVATKVVYIGAQQGTTWPYIGYMADFRLVDGSAESATPPTSPATAISGTNMLLNYTNAGIYDATSKNDLETVGNAQISTTQSKFGGSSMLFDGTGDWLRAPASPNLDMGTGDLTIEGWFYLTATVAVDYRMIVSDATNGNNYVAIRSGGTGGQLEINVNGTSFRLNLNNTVTINTWFHLAVVRYNGTWNGFVNGASLGTSAAAAAFNLGNGGTFVGRFGGGTAYEWPGYIDDLRITKGIARYTSNFIPPTTAFLTL